MASFEYQEVSQVSGAFVIKHKTFSDNRGDFFENFNNKTFSKFLGIETFNQSNLSRSVQGVIRGLHIQKNNPQGKLITPVHGSIFDVIVDLRPESPTFKQHYGVLLSSLSGTALYAPEGCAHGFLTMSEVSIVHYLCTSTYDEYTDGGINPLDPELKIRWPFGKEFTPILSGKDRKLPTLEQYLKGE